MKLRINVTYEYEVDPNNFPADVRKHLGVSPELAIHYEAPKVREILDSAIANKKKGLLVTMDVLQERPNGTS